MTSSLSAYRFQSVDFSFKTSSGDKISLNFYNKESLDYEKSSNGAFTKKELSLKKESGISISYEGNGIDEQDKKEIKEAMERLKKIVDKFFSKREKKEDDLLKNRIDNLIKPLKSSKNEKSDFLKHSLLDTFDKIIEKHKEEEKRLQNIFKEILRDFKASTFYA